MNFSSKKIGFSLPTSAAINKNEYNTITTDSTLDEHREKSILFDESRIKEKHKYYDVR